MSLAVPADGQGCGQHSAEREEACDFQDKPLAALLAFYQKAIVILVEDVGDPGQEVGGARCRGHTGPGKARASLSQGRGLMQTRVQPPALQHSLARVPGAQPPAEAPLLPAPRLDSSPGRAMPFLFPSSPQAAPSWPEPSLAGNRGSSSGREAVF